MDTPVQSPAAAAVRPSVLVGDATILESITDGFFALNHDWRIVYANHQAEALSGRAAGELLGKNLWDELPGLSASELGQAYRRVAAERVATSITAYDAAAERWYEARVQPAPYGISVYFNDVSQRKQAEEELKQGDKRKDEFLATLAHELRNPLAPLRNGVEIIRRAKGRPELVTTACELMERQLAHMVRLVDDLIDASRFSRGKIELRLERVALAQTVQLALETVRPLAAQASHTLEVDLPPDRMEVNGDPARLAQVFANLLNNAVKFTPTGGHIRLSARVDSGHVVVQVADNGVGIAPELQPTVFDMFTQGSSPGRRAAGGLGIGLSLVKGLVEMHGGAVTVQSAGQGRGSEFTVRLPLADPSASQQSTGRSASPAKPAGRCKVLVVDDNEDAANSLAELLELMGHDVKVANDGLGALAIAPDFRPAVVFLDIGMPHMNGHETARRMRLEPWGRTTALVALTGWGNAHDRDESRAAGFDQHLVKPGNFDDIEKIIGLACPPSPAA